MAEAHGLLIVAGGGNAGFGQLKVYDPLALDPEAIAADPDNIELLAAPFKGSTIISDQVGGAGTGLPAGTPEAVDVVTDDLTERWIAGQTPPEEYEITVDPPALSPYTLTVSGTAAPESTVTFVNTDGATETAEADENGDFSVGVSVTTGDSLELRRDSGTVRWRAGQRPGGALQVSPLQEAEPFTLTVRGDALAGVPVTLRDLTRGGVGTGWRRRDPRIPPRSRRSR